MIQQKAGLIPSSVLKTSIVWRSRMIHLGKPPTIVRRRQFSSTLVTHQVLNDAIRQDGTSQLVEQLGRVAELQARVAAENSKIGKQMIIAEYPDLRELLEYVYDPALRTHLTYSSLQKYLAADPPDTPKSSCPSTILELFEDLSRRRITGNEAKNAVWYLLMSNGITENQHLMDTFGRLLDRNLVAGFGANTLKQVIWPKDSENASSQRDSEVLVGSKDRKVEMDSPTTQAVLSGSKTTEPFKAEIEPSSQPTGSVNGKTPIHPKSSTLEKFEVALGKSVEPPFDPLFKDDSNWYASRKLDGVRCLTFLDFLTPTSSSPSTSYNGQLELVSVHFVSRTGKPFSTLSRLEDQLQHLSHLPDLRKWLDFDPLIVEERPEGVIKRLVLDGEVCVMRPKTSEELNTSQERDDGSLANSMWIANDPFIEDFTSTVSKIKRSDTIEHLSYFIFDVLSYAELNAKSLLKAQEGLGKKFGKRIEDIRYLTGWLKDHLDKLGDPNKEKMVKDLKQIKVVDTKQVEEMVERAAKEGWEGIILRKDEGYKGKRSTDIRKFKKWSDAEYVVKSIDTSSMRLAINGVFGEYQALASVWIEHDGHPVSVGSGFTAEQRIRYAKNPDDLIGKMITVEYFSESDSMERNKKEKGKDGGNKKSLRFPRIKMIWEEGKRGI